MSADQVTFEYVDSIEACLRCRALTRAESADDRRLVVSRDEVPVAVILAREPSLVKVTARNWTLLWSFSLVCEHMSFQVFELFAAIWVRTLGPFFALFVGRPFLMRDQAMFL